MLVIRTKYLGPTNSRGSRIKATCESSSVTIPYDSRFNGDECHKQAAIALLVKLGWENLPPMYGGHISAGEIVFVFADESMMINKAD